MSRKSLQMSVVSCIMVGMKRKTTHKGIKNTAYITAMRELRKSNASGTHDNRPNRLRTRNAIKANAIKEYN